MRKYAKISKVRSQVCSHGFIFNDFLCGRITCKSIQSAQKKRQCLPQISADKPQTPKTHKPHQPVFLCEIIQLCCIPLQMICILCVRHSYLIPEHVSAFRKFDDLNLLIVIVLLPFLKLRTHDKHRHPQLLLHNL